MNSANLNCLRLSAHLAASSDISFPSSPQLLPLSHPALPLPLPCINNHPAPLPRPLVLPKTLSFILAFMMLLMHCRTEFPCCPTRFQMISGGESRRKTRTR